MNPDRHVSRKFDVVIALVGMLLLTAFIGFCYDYYYNMNDDVLIKDILSGVYTGSPSGYNIQMLYPIGALISFFYHVWPHLPWYGAFICICHILCGFLVAIRFSEMTFARFKKVFFVFLEMFFIMAFLLWEVVFAQYTVTSGLLMATAMYWFYTTDSSLPGKKFLAHNIVSILLIAIAFGIRTEMALLLCPMLAVAGVIKWVDSAMLMEKRQKVIDGKKKSNVNRFFAQENVLKYFTLIIAAIIVMLTMFIADRIAYGNREWLEFNELFDSRTEIYDFQGIPEYEKHPEIYQTVGLSKEEHGLLLNYNYTLDDRIDARMFRHLQTMISDGGNKYFTVSLKDGLDSYFYRLTHKVDAPYIYLIWIAYISLIVTAIMLRNKSFLWKLPFILTVRSLLWMYLILRERMPERITIPLYVMEFLLLAALLIVELRKFKLTEGALYQRFWGMTILALFGIIGIGSMKQSLETVRYEQTRREIQNREWIAMQEYCDAHPQNFYLLDVYSTVAYSEKMFENVNNSMSNYSLAGGWASKSPLEREKFANYGIEKVENSLLNDDDIFFISYQSRSINWLQQYYEAKGIHVRIVSVDVLPFESDNAYVVYRVQKMGMKKMTAIYSLFDRIYGGNQL